MTLFKIWLMHKINHYIFLMETFIFATVYDLKIQKMKKNVFVVRIHFLLKYDNKVGQVSRSSPVASVWKKNHLVWNLATQALGFPLTFFFTCICLLFFQCKWRLHLLYVCFSMKLSLFWNLECITLIYKESILPALIQWKY